MYEDGMYLIILFFMSALWRGAWNLNVRYLISCPRVGGMVHHFTGTILLLVLNVYRYYYITEPKKSCKHSAQQNG